MENFKGDRICSIQIYKEGLNHPSDEPKSYKTRVITEIVNNGIAMGNISGWRAYINSRKYKEYGSQRGWERVTNESLSAAEQLGFTVIENDPDFPWKT